jgi:hypothetical protein
LERVLEMMARMWIPALALALAGCGNSDPGLQAGLSVALDQVTGLFSNPPPPPPQPSYAEVVALPFASIALSLSVAPDAPPALLAANALANGRVWYVDAARRGVVLEGGRIAGTRGMLRDVLSASHLPDDPLVSGALAANWPDATLLVHRARDGLGRESLRVYRCVTAFAGLETVTLYQRDMLLAHMTEDCAAAGLRFRNDHWIDPADGRMWKTRQFIGAEAGVVEVVVVRPFGS